MGKFAYGWKRQKPDPRDWRFKIGRRITTSLPTSVDLSAGMGPQLDQGSLGSCGPNTADELVEFDQRVEDIPVVSASRLFVYYATRQLMGTINEDSGVDNRTLLQALNQYGFCPESMWPYDVNQFTVKPPAACWNAAIANRIINYAAVEQALDQMQGCIVAGRPFMFGFEVYQQIEGDQAAQNGILTDPSGMSIGGHDVTFVGFNSTTSPLPGVVTGNSWPPGYFKFRNHWMNSPTQPWGDGGYGYISYAYATGSSASDFWVINAIPTAVPPGTITTPTESQVQAAVDSVFAAELATLTGFFSRQTAAAVQELQTAVDAAISSAFGG